MNDKIFSGLHLLYAFLQRIFQILGICGDIKIDDGEIDDLKALLSIQGLQITLGEFFSFCIMTMNIFKLIPVLFRRSALVYRQAMDQIERPRQLEVLWFFVFFRRFSGAFLGRLAAFLFIGVGKRTAQIPFAPALRG